MPQKNFQLSLQKVVFIAPDPLGGAATSYSFLTYSQALEQRVLVDAQPDDYIDNTYAELLDHVIALFENDNKGKF